MFIEIIKFIIYSALIVLISKYILVGTLRKLAENLQLKAKTIGNIAGYATSVPEFLTIIASSLRGLMGASIYNILSSNTINFIQYMSTIILNKNIKALKNRAIKIELILVIITIIVPIIFIKANVEFNLSIVFVFIICYFLFIFISNTVHKVYLNNEETDISKKVGEKKVKKNRIKIVKYIVVLIFTGILLFIIGELLGNTLQNLCNIFGVSQVIVGVLLGVMTSLPELITFFEAQKHHKNNENNMLGVVEATNNLLTSNILNLFIIQSIGISVLYLIGN